MRCTSVSTGTTMCSRPINVAWLFLRGDGTQIAHNQHNPGSPYIRPPSRFRSCWMYCVGRMHTIAVNSRGAALWRAVLQVLLALCRQTGGANQVRRRFLQLKVLEFLAREASLEYMCAHNQLAPSPSSSACSTPLSTTRTATGRSCRGSARGVSRTDPGGCGAHTDGFLGAVFDAAAGPGSSSARHTAGGGGGLLALGGAPGDRGSGSDGSAAAGTKQLQTSSPGCHVSARSASDKGVTRGGSGPSTQGMAQASADKRQPKEPSVQLARHTPNAAGPSPAAARAVAPASFELHNLQVAGDQNMLLATGSSDTLTIAGSLLRGDSGGYTPLIPRVDSSSRGGGDSDGADQAPSKHEQQQQQGPTLGLNVKAAVQRLETTTAAAATAAVPQLQPTPPKKPVLPGPVGGRRQPGHRRLVCADQPGPCGDSAAAAGAGAGAAQPGKALQSVCELQQLQEQPDSSAAGQGSDRLQQRTPAIPPIPKLQLPSSSNGSTADQQQQQQQQEPASTVSWQALDPGSPGAAPAAAGTDSSACVAPSSPRADLVGYEVPASVRSGRRTQQPQLTGDASMDNIIIDNWERETGLEFQFDGLSDGGKDGASSSACSTPREGASGGSSSARRDPGLRNPSGGTQGYPKGSFLRPQTPELALHQQLQSAAAAAPWSVPELVLGVEGRQGRWISSSDSVEDATAAGDGLFLGKVQLPVHGSNQAPAVCDEAASPSDPGPISKAQVPKLNIGGLGEPTAPVPAHRAAPQAAQLEQGDASVVHAQSPARSSSAPSSAPGSSGSPGSSQGSGSYRPGFDLEEDFERMMLAGDWEDSGSDVCSGSEAGDSEAGDRPDAAALEQHTSQQQQQQQQQRQQEMPSPQRQQQQQRQQLVPSLQLQPQQQAPEPPTGQVHGSSSAAAGGPSVGLRSPDTCAHTDVSPSKRKSGGKGKGRKGQAAACGGGHQAAAAGELLEAHALGDISGSSGSSDGGSEGYSSSRSSSDGEQEPSSRPGHADGADRCVWRSNCCVPGVWCGS
jgi:hypothetical protein